MATIKIEKGSNKITNPGKVWEGKQKWAIMAMSPQML